MNQFEIYRSIRSWEDMRTIEINILNGRVDFDSTKLEMCREVMKRMSDLLEHESTDAEYIVTNTFPHLKKGGWLYNYYIEQNKVEYGDYIYRIYQGPLNGEEKCIKEFSSKEDAVAEILSYYPQLKGFRTIESVISDLNF